MTIKPGIKEIKWMTAGALIFLAVTLMVLHVQSGQNPARQILFKAERLDQVTRVRLMLATASEAEKSAVMAVTDEDSLAFANQARAAVAEAERGRAELGRLLASGGSRGERDLLAQFAEAFTDFRAIDERLLDLAVRNTNVKAFALAYGPAAEALDAMHAALARLVEKTAATPGAADAAAAAFTAQSAAFHIQVLMGPHIAEADEGNMDALESRMDEEDRRVRKALDGLAAPGRFRGDPDLKTAAAAYARFGDIRIHILALSRENTNVISLGISLREKRAALFLCQDVLSSLEQAIREESVAGVDTEPVTNPRSLNGEKSEKGK